MASIGISEFTFGYAFLSEQTHAHWGTLKAAPILPNLQQEQQHGWDAHLPVNGIDFYYQFKLSDLLIRRNARFISDGTYAGPYYRFGLHPKNRHQQHQRLRALSQANPNTYYVAPEFESVDAFNRAFLARAVRMQSRLIPLQDCDDIYDEAPHYITFQSGHLQWKQHSEPKNHERSFRGEQLASVYRNTKNNWRPINQAFAISLWERNAEMIRHSAFRLNMPEDRAVVSLLDFDPRRHETRDVLLYTSQVLSVYTGATLMLVGE